MKLLRSSAADVCIRCIHMEEHECICNTKMRLHKENGRIHMYEMKPLRSSASDVYICIYIYVYICKNMSVIVTHKFVYIQKLNIYIWIS